MNSENQQLKMFVLVRSDLEHTYRYVQGMHAVAGYYESGNDTNWHNNTMVVLAVKDECALQRWQWRLQKANKL